MHCVPVDTEICASMMALWGGVSFVLPGRAGTLILSDGPERPGRTVALVAEARPRGRAADLVLLLDQAAGVLFVLGAAWLVWIRHGPMTWGFFAFAIEFNPGQAFQFYAWLQQWPPILLGAFVVTCLMQTAGYVGFLLFALRVPLDRAEGPWRWMQRALPVIGLLLLGVSLASLGNLFGHPAEAATRAGFLVGFAVDVAALGILLGRRRTLPPRDYQRIRWVIWGCLIGLPAFLVAQILQATSLPGSLAGRDVVPEYVTGLLYLVNGVLCLFVVEAVRRRTVVSVSIPLRRATVLGLLLSVPALFLHREVDALDAFVRLPGWVWVLVASVLAFLIARLHEAATELADRMFDLEYRRAEASLVAAGETIERAADRGELERLLVEEPVRCLKLASAALFRSQNGVFRRRFAVGWDATTTETLKDADPLLAGRNGSGQAYRLAPPAGPEVGLPDDLARPVLALPVSNPRRCFAVALYGGHEAGTALSHRERVLLTRLGRRAEIAYAELENRMLRARIAALERQLAHVAAD